MMIRVNNIYLYLKQYSRVLLLGLALLIGFASSAQCLDTAIHIGGKYDHAKYLEYCGAEAFAEEYSEEKNQCWSCQIIDVVFDGMKIAIVKIFDKIQPLCLLILPLGFAIWLAMYLLKALGSFATQDAGKVLDGIMIFIFKISLVYVIVSLGINEIVQSVITPLLSIGMDIGKEFSNMAGGAF